MRRSARAGVADRGIRVRSLKILLDTRSPGRAGIRSYTASLLKALARLEDGNEYVVLRAPGDAAWNVDGIEERKLPSDSIPRWYTWSNGRLPRLLRAGRFDVYHTVKHVTLVRGGLPRVATLHSSRFLIYPEQYRWYDAFYWQLFSRIAAARYDAIIAVSQAEKQNYVQRMGVAPERIHVTTLSADARFGIVTDAERLETVRRRYDLPERFVLYVGRMVPVKNLETLLRGFALARTRGLEHDLVLVGGKTWHSRNIHRLIRELGAGGYVHTPGAIYEDLPEVYNLADLCVLSSWYEAFGQVPLEAMACGTPVAVSDVGALPEVVGSAGAMFSPEDAGRLADLLVEICGSRDTRCAMRARGLEQSAKFTWERCALETRSLYERLASA